MQLRKIALTMLRSRALASALSARIGAISGTQSNAALCSRCAAFATASEGKERLVLVSGVSDTTSLSTPQILQRNGTPPEIEVVLQERREAWV